MIISEIKMWYIRHFRKDAWKVMVINLNYVNELLYYFNINLKEHEKQLKNDINIKRTTFKRINKTIEIVLDNFDKMISYIMQIIQNKSMNFN